MKQFILLVFGTLLTATAFGQSTVRGVVTDDDQRPLPGVSIVVKGTQNGTTTNGDGQFSLNVSSTQTLVLSFIGYVTKEVPVGAQTNLTVRLATDTKALNEVVVVGYGTQRRQDLTGSVASITETDLKKVPVASFDQSLQGRASGVQVTASSGQPGAGATVRIRGGNSITGGNDPLYVIDGFPISNPPSGGALRGPGLNPLAAISPNDIVSIEILKDASATAIYGARAANGVVLVTTKRGKAGKTRVELESYYGVQQVRKLIPMLNAKDYAILANEAEFNSGNGPNKRYTDAQIAEFGAGTDWQAEIYRPAPMQNHNLSVSGGTERTQYVLSANYFRQDGIMLNSDLTRGSFRLNLDARPSDRFKIGQTLTVSNAFANIADNDDGYTAGQGTGLVYATLAFNPTVPVYNPDGSYVFASPPLNAINNPVALAKEVTNTSGTFRALGSLFAEYEIVKDLKARVSFGGDVSFTKENYYAPATVGPGVNATAGNGWARLANVQNQTWLNENTLTYTKTLGSRHTLTGLLGYTVQTNRLESQFSGARGFPNDLLETGNIGAGSTPLAPGSNVSDWTIASYLARVNYNLSDRYLFTVSGRADGSSRFGAGNKWGFFPSGAFAWRMSEEPFIKKSGVFSDLKLRLSYGITGNQDIPQYQSLSALGTVNYVFGNTLNTGFRPTRIANPDLKWETTSQSDIGLDVSVLKGRISLTADLYYKKTKDLLLSVPLPWSSGFSSALKNIGSVENRGFELAITSDNVTGNFTWTTSLNYAVNRNKVLDLGGEQLIINGNITSSLAGGSGFSVLKVGEPLGAFYGYQFDGLYQTEEEVKAAPVGGTVLLGYTRYKDLSGPAGTPDGKLDGLDRTIIGNAQPKFIGGITNTFTYKGLELSVFFQGSYGNKILYLQRVDLESMKANNNGSAVSLQRWTGPGTSNYYPRAYRTTPREAISDRFVEDGSFLRMRTISLAYNLPSGWLEKIRLRNARVYVTGQNLLTFTNYTGYDPEGSAFGRNSLAPGVDISTYPMSKTILFGINLGF